jgi:phosphoglycerate dehydrogenase-like enzyme
MTNPISRRAVLGAATAATAAAVGLALHDSSHAAEAPGRPRLPMKVLLRAALSDENLKRIAAISPEVTAGKDIDLADADVVFGNVSRDELAKAKRLRWVQCPSAGVEHTPLAEYIERDVILTNAKGCYGPQIAEHAFGLLFAITRGIAQQARQNKWGYDGPQPIEMRGRMLGVIGLGGIGREVARRARAMDMRVIAVDAEAMTVERFAMVDEVALVDDGLDALLERSDVVVSCCPSTPKSRGMLGAKQFARMRDGAYVINVSRGKIVQTDALLDALKSGKLAGAGLDVTDPEPLPADHALWAQPNVVITSHIAGKSQFAWDRVEHVFAENVNRFCRKLPMLNVVEKAKGY